MEVLRLLAEEEYPVETYTITEGEITLYIRNQGKKYHSYHPELDKKIKEIGNVMTKVEESQVFTVEGFLDGIFQKSIVEYGESTVERETQRFDKELEQRFIQIEKDLASSPKKKEFKIRKEEFAEMIVEGCRRIREGELAGRSNFSSSMLYDAYLFLLSSKTSLEFLSDIHLVHGIRGSLSSAGAERGGSGSAGRRDGGRSSAEDVAQYVQEKYHKGMFHLDMYNNRFVFAELFHYIRAGLFKDAVEFAETHEGFFQEICRNFSGSLFLWMRVLGVSEKRSEKAGLWEEEPQAGDDPFKLFFHGLFSGSRNAPKEVIVTIEDFLWYQLILNKSLEEGSAGGKKAVSSVEIFEAMRGAMSTQRLFLASIVLKQWRSAMELLYDERFAMGEILFLSCAIAGRIKEEEPTCFPVKRKEKCVFVFECINVFVRIVQHITLLFLKPEEKLSVIYVVTPFISQEWAKDLVTEVFIASEDFSVLGSIDSNGRRNRSTLKEYVDAVSTSSVIQKISNYYVHSGELEKALKVSYLANSGETLEILSKILIDKIKKKDFAENGLGQIVKHFNNGMVNILWAIIELGGAKNNITSLIKSTGLIAQPDTASVLKKAQEISELAPEIKSVIPFALGVIGKRLGETVTYEHQEMGKALLLLAGVLEIDRAVVQDIVQDISSLL
ncbi:hypothetical protein NECID01_1298 [Nematocida sp. AWRm77]|nr:hypothetical protein NECID01_1298 [Nematocida sp. AWRm77]